MSAALSPHVQEALAPLNDRQRAFVLAYKCGETKGNAGRSYEAAGYSSKGDNADALACRLTRNVKIVKALDYLEQELQEQAGEVVDGEVDYRREWYRDVAKDIGLARGAEAFGPVMTGHKLLAGSERYDLEVNRTTHDVAPELREAIRDRIAGARARTIEANQGENDAPE